VWLSTTSNNGFTAGLGSDPLAAWINGSTGFEFGSYFLSASGPWGELVGFNEKGTVTDVPEPGTLGLLTLGFVGLFAFHARRGVRAGC
jgi:hypothetical protein